MPEPAVLPSPRRRGPNTPGGKARSAMNARKHGLRARAFALLPEEDPAEWRQHVRNLTDGYRPVDATEEELVTAIAAAMWQEIRADRFEAGVLHRHPPRPARLPRAQEGQAGRPAADGAPEHARTRASKRHERFIPPAPARPVTAEKHERFHRSSGRPRLAPPPPRGQRPGACGHAARLACPSCASSRARSNPSGERFTSESGCGHE